MKAMDLFDLVERAHEMSKSKGWWEEGPPNHERIAAKLALIHSEVSEALECVRDDDMVRRIDQERCGKPEGLPSELADVVIRVADLCGALGICLHDAIVEKMLYNASRKHRHGGRKL